MPVVFCRQQHADQFDPRQVAAHLRACGPCGEDFAGLLIVVSETSASPDGR